MDPSKLTAEDIMARIRSHLAQHWSPAPAAEMKGRLLDRDAEFQHHHTYLNLNFDTGRIPRSTSRLRHFFKRLMCRIIFFHTSQQVPFNQAAVVVFNKLIQAVRELDNRQFRQNQLVLQAADQLRELQVSRDQFQDELKSIKEKLRELADLMARTNQVLSQAVRSGTFPSVGLLSETEYHRFEDLFRGPETTIREYQLQYLDLLPLDRGAILDIGCGRGEFLEACRKKGLQSLGIDTNKSMVDHCREKGLDVTLSDAVSYLAGTDLAFGGVVALQVMEHWDANYLGLFLDLLNRKLNPGGVFIMETINLRSVLASCDNFYRDPTHRTKLHPDTASFLLQRFGYSTEIRWLSPVSPSYRLEPVPESGEMKRNFEKLDQFLYGFQDYALVARKPHS